MVGGEDLFSYDQCVCYYLIYLIRGEKVKFVFADTVVLGGFIARNGYSATGGSFKFNQWFANIRILFLSSQLMLSPKAELSNLATQHCTPSGRPVSARLTCAISTA